MNEHDEAQKMVAFDPERHHVFSPCGTYRYQRPDDGHTPDGALQWMCVWTREDGEWSKTVVLQIDETGYGPVPPEHTDVPDWDAAEYVEWDLAAAGHIWVAVKAGLWRNSIGRTWLAEQVHQWVQDGVTLRGYAANDRTMTMWEGEPYSYSAAHAVGIELPDGSVHEHPVKLTEPVRRRFCPHFTHTPSDN